MRVSAPATLFLAFARAALAAAFASAVADRFGFWGPEGAPGIAWGNWSGFVGYTSTLTWYLPDGTAPASAIAATTAEVVLTVWLCIGVRLREAALASGVLLLIFGISMAGAHGIKAPLDYSVFSASAAAMLLAAAAQRDKLATEETNDCTN